MPRKKKSKQAKVNPELEGLEVGVDKFGEITSTVDVEKINEFLNKNVEDKKLKDREDI